MPIKDYLTIAASNTSISSINIAEGCNPANVNNAIRRMMADIASEFVSNSNIASAATIDLGALAGSATITGTAAITSFGVAPLGLVRRVWFADSLVLTHHSTSLILKGGANITTASGDFALFESLGSGNWRMALYVRADGSVLNGVLSSTGFENPIINGDFSFWQRGTSLTVGAGGSGYLADRWQCYSPNAGTYSRSSDVPVGFLYSMDVNAGIGQIFQRIESSIARYYAGKIVTITINAKKVSGTGALDCQLYYPGSTDNWSSSNWIASATFSANPATEFAEYKATFNAPLPSQVANGLTVSILPSASMNYRITGIRLEIGSGSPDFIFRPMAMELALCQRYYEKSYDPDTVPGTITHIGAIGGITSGTNLFAISHRYCAQKRIIPTITFYNPISGVTGTWQDSTNVPRVVGLTGSFSAPSRSSFSAFAISGINGQFFGHYVSDAEIY